MLDFLTMCVTHQDNDIIQFSDNVFDTSGQPYHPIFWQCVWQIRQTVSLYHPIFWQCLWHIWSTTLSNFLTMCVTYQDDCITVSSHFPTMSVTYQAKYFVKGCDGGKKREKKKKESNRGTGGHYIVANQLPNGNQLQCRRSCQFSDNVCDISQELYQFIIPFSKQCLWQFQIILLSCDAWCLTKHFLTAHVTYQLYIRDKGPIIPQSHADSFKMIPS